MKKNSFPKNWDKVYSLWRVRELNGIQASEKLNISRATFYKLVKKQTEFINGHEKK